MCLGPNVCDCGDSRPPDSADGSGPNAHYSTLESLLPAAGAPPKACMGARAAAALHAVCRAEAPAALPAPPFVLPPQQRHLPAPDIARPPCTAPGEIHARLALAAPGSVSVSEAFTGATVLVTGATGFVGSTVLEQLLRLCPRIARVYVLIRNKRGASGETRLDKLLARPLFHLHHVGGEVRPEVRKKLTVVDGDITAPDLGLSLATRCALVREVHYVVHSAASISFQEHVHTLLSHNYVATRRVADLAGAMKQLRGFVHISTAYVNSNRPRGSHVEERIHNLELAGNTVDHDAIAGELAALPPDAAVRRASHYLRGTGHVNAYTFTKALTEAAIAARHCSNFPVAIVRPSIVGALAAAPCPGFFGNSAGATAYIMAFATGISQFTCHKPSSVFDVVPADVCAAVILTAAAALAKAPALDTAPPLVVHACASDSNPDTQRNLFDKVVFPFWSADPPKYRLCRRYKTWEDPNSYVPERSWRFCMLTLLSDLKFRLVWLVLWLLGHARVADKVWSGWQAWRLYNREALDFNLFFCCNNARALRRALAPGDAASMQLLWEAPGDDLGAYFTAHMHYMRAHFFKS